MPPSLRTQGGAAAPVTDTLFPTFARRALINHWTYEGERVIHGNPSGVDNTTCVFGGVIKFKRGAPFEFVQDLPSIRMLVVNTCIGRDTRSLVAGVTSLVQSPIYGDIMKHVLNATELTVQQWLQLFEKVKTEAEEEHKQKLLDETIPHLFALNQGLLITMGISHPSIDCIIHLAKQYGLAGKLTGAGGGGCLLLFQPSQLQHPSSTSTSTSSSTSTSTSTSSSSSATASHPVGDFTNALTSIYSTEQLLQKYKHLQPITLSTIVAQQGVWIRKAASLDEIVERQE